MKKVVVGMSGGVDSSVTAYLLKEQGYEVTGVFIEAYNEPGCRTDQDKKDALQVALKLGIPFVSLDLRKEYKEKVVKYFFETYKAGATPNPDIVCNREVKFGLFYNWAKEQGFESVATGHYARVYEGKYIQRAVDLTKDQSYFLWQVTPAHLKNILWPLGDKKKEWVRAKAKELGLPNADKPDSMGVCMMGELNVKTFLKQHLGELTGDVIWEGKVVGQHRGLWFQTVGQRGGIELDKKQLKKLGYEPEKMEPFYVIGKDVGHNQLIVGTREQAMRDNFAITNYELRIKEKEIATLLEQQKMFVRIRNLGELYPVLSLKIEDSRLIIKTVEALFGVAEGQAATLYAREAEVGEEVIVGGGTIAT